MGTAKFYKAVGAVMRDGDAHDQAQRLQDAYDTVRDDWLAKRDYTTLVKAILGNWTCGNCVPYMLPLSAALLGSGEHALHRTLWAHTVKRQVDTFFRNYTALRSARVNAEALLAVDTRGFNEFDTDHYADGHRACGFLLQRLFDSLAIWRGERVGAGLPATEPDAITASLWHLRKPRIVVARLPPG